MGPETFEIQRKSSEQPLVSGSPSQSVWALLQARGSAGHRAHGAARARPLPRRGARTLAPGASEPLPAERGLRGAAGRRPARDPGAPRLGPRPEQPPPPAPRPRTPARPCPAGGRAAPGPAHRARLRSARHRPSGRSRTPGAPRPGRAAPARPRGSAPGPEGPQAAAHHGGGCAGLSPPGSGGH